MKTLFPHPMKAAHTLSQSVKILAFCQVYRAFMGPKWGRAGGRLGDHRCTGQ